MPTVSGSSLANLSDGDLVAMLNSGGAAAPSGTPAPANSNVYTQAIGSNESNNAPDTAAIVNPASGARSSMQVMPKTAIDPGFGVTPSNGTPADDARMGRDYYNALLSKYNDPTTAAIAYDWGPGHTDKWIKNGADLSKVPNESLAYALNFNSKTGAGGNPVSAQGAPTNSPGQQPLPSQAFDAYLAANPGTAQPNASDPGILTSLGAGLGRGVQQGVLGAQSLVGRGISALGGAMGSDPLSNVGTALVNDAASGNAQGEKDFQANGGGTFAGKAGNVVGQVAPALLLPAEALPQIAGAATMGAGDASLNNGNIAAGTVGGAAGGALGVAGGHLLAGALGALSPQASKLMDALRGGDNAAAANIAKTLQPDEIKQVIANLNANADSPINGVQRTAAEAADNSTITGLQRAVQNTPAGSSDSGITGRLNANNAARMQAGQDAVGPSANNPNMMGPGLEQETDAFTQAQAQRVAQGQTELSPVDDTQAATMQTPAYQQAINGARRSATNSGVRAFADQSDALNQGLASQIDQVAGTPDTLDQAYATRQAQGNSDYAGVAGDIPADTPAFNDLAARPGFRTALNRAAGIEEDMNGSAAADAISTGAPTRSLQLGDDGSLNWVETPGARTVDAGVLQGARSQLSSMANKAAQAGDAAVAKGYRDTLSAIDGFLGNEEHVGPDIANSFNTARANYSNNSVPIDRQTYLQTKLAGAVNNVTGEVNPDALNSTINSVARDQLKPGMRPADRITQPMLDQLKQIGQQARNAPTNMTGLSPEGQELIRQQLAANAGKSAESKAAFDAFNQYLGGQSKGYSAAQAAETGTGASLASRQALSGALDKMSDVANNAGGESNITLGGARRALKGANLTGPQAEYAANLLDDLKRATTANASVGAAGSQTAANGQATGGLLGALGKLGHAGTVNAAIVGGDLAGGLGSAAAIASHKLVAAATKAAEAKTSQAALDLFLNPKKMAAALQKYQDSPSASQAFINAMKTKALGAGKKGAVAVQAFEAANQ